MKYFLFCCLISLSAWASKRELVVRASDVDGFPAQANCFFSNNRMVAHTGGLLVQYTCFGGADIFGEIWWVKGSEQRKLFTAKLGNLFTTPVSDGAHVFVVEFNEGGVVHLLEHDLSTLAVHKLASEVQSVHDLAVFSEGKLWVRFSDQNGLNREATWTHGAWSLAAVRGVSYFFSAGHSDQLFAQKVRLGAPGELGESQPDEIQVRVPPQFVPTTVVRDRDGDAQSPYLSFWNFSVVNGKFWSVIAKRAEGNVALIGTSGGFREIKLYETFGDLDLWPAALTSDGTLVIRATHKDGRKGLWVLDGEPRLLLTLGDTVETDLGTATVGETLFYNAPLANGERIFIGVGLTEFGSRTSYGQGILSLSIR